jgi:hypothetical protein
VREEAELDVALVGELRLPDTRGERLDLDALGVREALGLRESREGGEVEVTTRGGLVKAAFERTQ